MLSPTVKKMAAAVNADRGARSYVCTRNTLEATQDQRKSMIESPTTAPRPPITREEHYWAGFYAELMERYATVDAIWAVPMMAVRIYTKRVGLDRMLQLLVLHGAPVIAERCRHELTVRQEFLAHLLANYPPPDSDEAESAIEEMAEDLATIDCPEGAMRLLKFLDRLRNRELMLKASNGTVH
jgi:hypothetical protein